MVSQIKVNEIIKQSWSTITIGETNDTITLPSTATLTNFPANTPAFWFALSTNQSISNNTVTKIQFNTTTLDTGSFWDSSNYRWTPTVSGYYFTNCQYKFLSSGSTSVLRVKLQKNGTDYCTSTMVSTGGSNSAITSGFVHLNGSSDYIEAYAQHQEGSTELIGGDPELTFFQGYKIIGA